MMDRRTAIIAGAAAVASASIPTVAEAAPEREVLARLVSAITAETAAYRAAANARAGRRRQVE